MSSSAKNLISDAYRRQLSEKHKSDNDWGNTGILHFDMLLHLVDLIGAQSILDYGCGKGTVGARFREEQQKPGSKYANIAFYEYDPAIPGKTDTSTKGDILFNTDVLEHIEPDLIDNVLADMASRTLKAAFMLISTEPAMHLLPDGRNAHLIIESPEWWNKKVEQHFTIVQAQTEKGGVWFIVARKQQGQQTGAVSDASPEQKIIQQANQLIEEKKYTQARLLLSGINDFRKAPAALFALGEINYHTNDLLLAANYYLEYAKFDPDPKTYRMAGLALSKVENYEAALKCLEMPACIKVFATDPEYLEALMLSWNKLNTPDKTIKLYEGHGKLGLLQTVQYIDALILVQRLDDALVTAEKLTLEEPARGESWSVLERAYTALRKFDKALEASKKAVELEPGSAVFQCNLGFSYLFVADVDKALAGFNKATELDPLMMAPYLNRSTIYRHKHDYAHLAADLDSAYEISPASPDVHYATGVAALKQDQYVRAFAELEWYWHKNKLGSFRMPASLARWYGEDISNKTLMFYADQGVGDIVMMMRYIPDLVEKYKPRHLVINVNPKMEALFTASFPHLFENGQASFFANASTASEAGVDCIVAATSLPHILGISIETIPHTKSYLKKKTTIDYKSGTGKDFVIGISWYTKSLDMGYIRSLRLADFSFLAKYDNIRIVDLQYGDTAAERAENAANGFEIFHDDSIDSWTAMQPFVDQVAACDLIISIDNTTVHVAGALGVPCWTILAQEPYWRWPVAGNATPWYESLRLFRQKSKDYGALFAELENEFKKYLDGDRSVLTPAPYKSPYPQEKPKKTAVIINDTQSCYSWGHYAALKGIKDDLSTKGYAIQGISMLELSWFTPHLPSLHDFDNPKYLAACRYRDPTLFHYIQHADEVIINGDAMMSGLSEHALRLLYLAYIAKHFYKRKVSIINHSVYPEDSPSLTDATRLAFYHKVYTRLDHCVVRDKYSFDLLKSIDVKAVQGIDTSPLWLKNYLENTPPFQKTKTAVITCGVGYNSGYAPLLANLCIRLKKDGIQPILLKGALWHTAQEDLTLERDVQELAPDTVQPVTAGTAGEFVRYLAEAKIVISGFYSVCVMAHALGTSLVSLTKGSQGLAMMGLSKITDMPPSFFYEDPEISKKLPQAVHAALNSPQVTQKIQKSRLETLAYLAEKNVNCF